MSNLEQLPPNKPNFRLIGVLSIMVMIAIFLFAFFVLHWDGHQLIPAQQKPPVAAGR